VFGCQPIVDDRDDGAAGHGECPGQRVIAVQCAGHPAAAVAIDQAGQSGRGGGAVDAYRDRV
jgi:hypothetical protein